jgi:hypothetical protein
MVKFFINCGIIHRDFAYNLFLSKINHNILFSHKGMRKVLLITFLILFFVTGIEAQLQNKSNAKDIKSTDLEIGPDGLHRPAIPGQFSITLSGCPAFLFGDIGGALNNIPLIGATDLAISNIGFLFSVGAHHLFPNNFGLKASVYYGNLSGTDAGTDNGGRGYAFKSDIWELAIQGEYFFYGGPYSKSNNRNSWYVFAGVGIINSHAALKYNNNTITGTPPGRPNDIISLDPKAALLIPFGLGYQYRLNDKLTFGAEFGYQYIASDFVDGIIPTGSQNNDAIAILSLSVVYKLYESGKTGESGQTLKNRCNCVWQ